MAISLEQAEAGTILKVLAGSHIHGLNQPTSDRDEEAIVIEPLEAAYGLHQPWEDLVRESPEKDVKYFSLRKWCRMALNGNPNFLLMLFAPPSHILRMDARGSQLRDMAPMFISRVAIKSHLGYMQGQRQRLINHNKEFASGGGHGKPRFELIERYGYDTKFAMHLLRLGFQGCELGETGRLVLPMDPETRDVLMQVRNGEESLDFVLDTAAILETKMKRIFDSNSCKLPDGPDYAAIEQFMLKCYIRTWAADRVSQDIREDARGFQSCE